MSDKAKPTKDELEAVLHENLEGWKAYQEARAAGTTKADNPHRAAYQAYSRAARQRREHYPRQKKAKAAA